MAELRKKSSLLVLNKIELNKMITKYVSSCVLCVYTQAWEKKENSGFKNITHILYCH